jgi:haloalkane dehalogenase
MIDFVRTPDDSFANLPGYTFEPHYLTQSNGLRMHYLDEGEGDRTFLCLHGQPSWSYLYRKMLPIFAEKGRVIAPDLFGFGKSDKPTDQVVYTFDFHRAGLVELVETLDLQNVTLVCQDWGGLLGLTLPPFMAERFNRLIIMNTGFATGEVPLGDGFKAWQLFNRSQPDMDIAALMQRGTGVLSDAEAAAYAAPFPDMTYKAGVRQFPELVPGEPDAPGAKISQQSRDWWRDTWSGQSFMAIGASDPVITKNAMIQMHSLIRGCPPPMIVEEAGHFVQEWGEPIARAALVAFGD